jgi:16S rRNA (guanine527-N7)-methyltransferase
LERHYELLLSWSRRINLTALREPQQIIQQHFGESLFIVRHVPAGVRTFADLGSGAGFPGFPLAVALPLSRVTLVESNARKVAFLKEISRGVQNVWVRQQRAEMVEDQFDCVVLRGVSAAPFLDRLSKHCALLLSLTGPSEVDKLTAYREFVWEGPFTLPWSTGRVLLRGVSRGTQSRKIVSRGT